MNRPRLWLLMMIIAALWISASLVNAQGSRNNRGNRGKGRAQPAGTLAPEPSPSPSPSPSTTDGTPPGMVAFFMATGCPAGWTVPTAAQGRLIVGVTTPSSVGLTLNDPMANQTPPTHTNDYSVTLSMSSKSISASTCCNNQGAAAKGYTVKGTTAAATSNLPFMQLPVCQKQ
jgi:hypothetical protein